MWKEVEGRRGDGEGMQGKRVEQERCTDGQVEWKAEKKEYTRNQERVCTGDDARQVSRG